MLKEYLKKNNLDKHYTKLIQLRDLTLEYNKNVNLTAIRNEEEFDLKNIVDSLLPIEFYDLDNKKILDVGTGGGFPGLVLAIVFPNSKFTLIDSNNKKITWIKYAIKELDINNVEVIQGRVEEQDFKDKFDLVVSRAVASLNILIEICSNSINKNGEMLFYKGSNVKKEFPKDWKSINKIGLEFIEIKEIKLHENTERTFIRIKKIDDKSNPARKFANIIKEPIY